MWASLRITWWVESWVSPRVHARSQYVTVSLPSADELAAHGGTTLATRCSLAARAFAATAAYDAMIADQAMPVMTGLQLAATVVERHPGIRVVLASPHGRLPASARQFLQLDKPFRPEELETLLGGLAPQARAA